MADFNQFRGRLIAPQSCAEALDNSEFTIHRWIREGKIKAVKLSSRCTRIDGDSLADFLVSRTFDPKVAKPTASELAGQG